MSKQPQTDKLNSVYNAIICDQFINFISFEKSTTSSIISYNNYVHISDIFKSNSLEKTKNKNPLLVVEIKYDLETGGSWYISFIKYIIRNKK